MIFQMNMTMPIALVEEFSIIHERSIKNTQPIMINDSLFNDMSGDIVMQSYY